MENHHYLHRKPPISSSFGIFRKKPYDNRIVEQSSFDGRWKKLAGVITYGTPSSSPLREGICGEEEKDNVIELNRLWTRDNTPKNLESFFIMNTVSEVDKEIVVSYADTKEDHNGTVYQACNWYFTGRSAVRYDWKVEGVEGHSQSLADKYSADELREKFGDRFYKEERSKKYRYVYFNCDARRERKLKDKLNYKIKEEYPKVKA